MFRQTQLDWDKARIVTRLFISMLALLATLLAFPVSARQAPSPPLQARADEMVDFLNGEPVPEGFFTHAFLAEIPATRIVALAGQLRAQNGDVTNIAITPSGPTAGTITVEYERAVATVQLVLEPAAPHRVNGLLVSNIVMRDDSFAAIAADIAALPGKAAFTVARLGPEGPVAIAGHEADRALGVGSSFKLYVLAEAARQIAAGERRWADVVPLGSASRPSGITQNWPDGVPMTLHALAALMISISDNTATDTLMETLGRDRIDAMAATAGHARAHEAAPLLTTREFFALKLDENADLRARWSAADPAGRRALLSEERERLTLPPMRMSDFAGVPVAIGEVEWFASPADMARLLDWLRVNGGEDALAIMAIDHGAPPAVAADWRYLGFKGGSEAGVIALNYLAEDRDGNWFAVSGSWNDPAAAVDEARFQALMIRALQRMRAGGP